MLHEVPLRLRVPLGGAVAEVAAVVLGRGPVARGDHGRLGVRIPRLGADRVGVRRAGIKVREEVAPALTDRLGVLTILGVEI